LGGRLVLILSKAGDPFSPNLTQPTHDSDCFIVQQQKVGVRRAHSNRTWLEIPVDWLPSSQRRCGHCGGGN
jgi:hypothetical protein